MKLGFDESGYCVIGDVKHHHVVIQRYRQPDDPKIYPVSTKGYAVKTFIQTNLGQFMLVQMLSSQLFAELSEDGLYDFCLTSALKAAQREKPDAKLIDPPDKV